MKKIFFIISILSANIVCAQNCFDCQWRFGVKAGLDFTSGSPVAVTDCALTGDEAFASIADSNGNLLFYTNEFKIFNSQNSLIENGDSLCNPLIVLNDTLIGGSTITQGSLILPFPGSNNLYYVFANQFYATPAGLSYSIVDMNFNGGLGKVINKNIPLLLYALSEKMIAIKHGNGRDWWLIVHEWETNKFFKFLITPLGISGPFTQAIGNYDYAAQGQMTASKNGERIAYLIPYNGGLIDMYDFDRCSGMLLNFDTLVTNFTPDDYTDFLYGASFSPSGNILYIGQEGNCILQYNVMPGHYSDLPTCIWDTLSGFPDNPGNGQFQLANNNKVYISFWAFPFNANDTIYDHYLHVINQPDSLALACDFQIEGVYLGGKTTLGSLPNMPNYNLGRLVVSECDTVYNGIEGEIDNRDISVSIYPNPNDGSFNIYSTTTFTGKVSISIYNVLGSEVLKNEENMNSGTVKMQLNLAAGIYYCKVMNEGTQLAEGKVVVVR